VYEASRRTTQSKGVQFDRTHDRGCDYRHISHNRHSQFLYQAKAKQTEAKSNLVALHTSEIAYFAENNGFIDDFNAIGFDVSGASQRYYYELGGASLGTLPPGCTASTLDVVSATSFTAVAIGNIDGDATCDVWTIADQKVLTNVINDVSS